MLNSSHDKKSPAFEVMPAMTRPSKAHESNRLREDIFDAPEASSKVQAGSAGPRLSSLIHSLKILLLSLALFIEHMSNGLVISEAMPLVTVAGKVAG